MPIIGTLAGASARGFGGMRTFAVAGSDFEGIASYTVTGSATSSYTFTSIPQTYKHLYIVAEIFGTTANEDLAIQVGNGSVDTASNYSGGWTRQLTGSSITTSQDLNNSRMRLSDGGSPSGSTHPMILDMYMPMYSSTTAHKPAFGHTGNSDRGQDLVSGKWRSNSAIDTIKFYMLVGNLDVNTKISIFGIKG